MVMPYYTPRPPPPPELSNLLYFSVHGEILSVEDNNTAGVFCLSNPAGEEYIFFTGNLFNYMCHLLSYAANPENLAQPRSSLRRWPLNEHQLEQLDTGAYADLKAIKEAHVVTRDPVMNRRPGRHLL